VVADVACGLLLALVAITVAAGIGVVGFGALLALLITLAWVGIEGGLGRVRRRLAIRRRRGPSQRLQSGS
jgi:hypothetical protein